MCRGMAEHRDSGFRLTFRRYAVRVTLVPLCLLENLCKTYRMINPSSLVDCELWYESEDKVYLDKLCECTVKITEAICQPGKYVYQAVLV